MKGRGGAGIVPLVIESGWGAGGQVHALSGAPSPELVDRAATSFDPRPVAPATRWYAAFKRTFDVVVAALAVVASAPLFLALMLAVRVSSSGPAFYSQMRVGTAGRHFRCWKFRTMILDADTRLLSMLASSPAMRAEYEGTLKLRRDPRITRVGRFLRRTSLDELPQLWNVLRGEMSVVGPRPLLLDEPLRYGDALPAVLSVRPGLTGLWQVSGRNAVPYDVRVEMQYEQARSKTVSHDLAIVLRTFVQMLRWRSNGAS